MAVGTELDGSARNATTAAHGSSDTRGGLRRRTRRGSVDDTGKYQEVKHHLPTALAMVRDEQAEDNLGEHLAATRLVGAVSLRIAEV